MELASAYEADVANFHCIVWPPWTWFPQGMSISMKVESELLSVYVEVSHVIRMARKKPLMKDTAEEKVKTGNQIRGHLRKVVLGQLARGGNVADVNTKHQLNLVWQLQVLSYIMLPTRHRRSLRNKR